MTWTCAHCKSTEHHGRDCPERAPDVEWPAPEPPDEQIARLTRERDDLAARLFVPVEWVQGVDDGDEVCTGCGTPVTTPHTWKDCIATFEATHAQVAAFEREERERLTRERDAATERLECADGHCGGCLACSYRKLAESTREVKRLTAALADRDARLGRIQATWEDYGLTDDEAPQAIYTALDGWEAP